MINQIKSFVWQQIGWFFSPNWYLITIIRLQQLKMFSLWMFLLQNESQCLEILQRYKGGEAGLCCLKINSLIYLNLSLLAKIMQFLSVFHMFVISCFLSHSYSPGPVRALSRVDGCTWTSNCQAPGQVPSSTDHLVKCYLKFGDPDRFPLICANFLIFVNGTWPSAIEWHLAKW